MKRTKVFFSIFMCFILLISIITPNTLVFADSNFQQSAVPNSSVKALQIYPSIPQLPDWAEAYGQGAVTCDAVSIEEFNETPDIIWDYDVIAIGFWDCNNHKDITAESKEVIIQYIDAGFGALFGHDTVYEPACPNLWDLRNYVKLSTSDIGTDFHYNVKIRKEGLLTSYPNQLGTVETVLRVPPTHDQSQDALGNIWITFSKSEHAYLSTWNHCGYIQIGHSNEEVTEAEQKIAINTLYYLAQRTTSAS